MEQNSNKSTVSRRSFLGTTAAVAAGITILPSNVVAGLGHKAPSDKLNILGVGVGGMGFANLKNLASENIIGLVDVDWKYTGGNGVFDRWPNAKKYKDWRIAYDELGKSMDGVVVALPTILTPLLLPRQLPWGKMFMYKNR
jgi:hypothetical protein